MLPNKSSKDDELAQLEMLLQATLLPRLPRSNYGDDLQRRLSNRSAPTLEFPPPDYSLVWLFLSILFLMILILFGIRKLIFTGKLAENSRLRRSA